MYRILAILFVTSCVACSLETSPSTGWDYNNPRNGGFQKVPYFEQETGPGLELIEGGMLNIPMLDSVNSVIVPSFYLDRTEITNQDWCEYMYWTKRTFGTDYPEIAVSTLPDTNAWRKVQGYSEAMEVNYSRHPAFSDYPVVGVSWMQANNYCAWRTDRVNEYILIREGILLQNPNQQNEPFTTDAYLYGQYYSGMSYNGQLADLDPSKVGGKDLATRIVRREDGILLPRYRLPTEAEWEYAYVGSTEDYLVDEKNQLECYKAAQNVMGDFVKSSDYNRFNGHVVAPVNAFLPNDFGIYNLAGNVQEWTMDSYSDEDRLYKKEVSPYEGESMQLPLRNSELQIEEKLSFPMYDIDRLKFFLDEFKSLRLGLNNIDSLEYDLFREVNQYIVEAKKYEENGRVMEANEMINIIYHDVFADYNNQYRGANFHEIEMEVVVYLKQEIPKYLIDLPGNIRFNDISPWQRINARNGNLLARQMLDSNNVYNETKIVKGASWKDENKLMDPFQRRTMNQFETSATIGFRCAMDRMGSPIGLGKKKRKQKSESKIKLD